MDELVLSSRSQGDRKGAPLQRTRGTHLKTDLCRGAPLRSPCEPFPRAWLPPSLDANGGAPLRSPCKPSQCMYLPLLLDAYCSVKLHSTRFVIVKTAWGAVSRATQKGSMKFDGALWDAPPQRPILKMARIGLLSVRLWELVCGDSTVP